MGEGVNQLVLIENRTLLFEIYVLSFFEVIFAMIFLLNFHKMTVLLVGFPDLVFFIFNNLVPVV